MKICSPELLKERPFRGHGNEFDSLSYTELFRFANRPSGERGERWLAAGSWILRILFDEGGVLNSVTAELFGKSAVDAPEKGPKMS